MLRALVETQDDPQQLAQLAKGQLRRKHDDLVLALKGRVNSHHRFLLRLQIRRLDLLEAEISTVEDSVRRALVPYQRERALLLFRSVKHPAAWLGLGLSR